MSASPADYLPFLCQAALAAGIGAVVVGASHLLGQRARRNRIKDSAYECGIPGGEMGPVRFPVKFHVTAMLFILFDIEAVLLLPWVFIHREFVSRSLPILAPVLFFLAVLATGLFYELRKGALDWEK